MYLRGNMHQLVYSFRWGFLSDRIVEVLSKYTTEDNITGDQKEVIAEGISFIEMTLSGRKQITTRTYESNALESIKIYNKSLSIVLEMPDLPSKVDIKEIEKTFKDLKHSLRQIIDGKPVSTKEIKRTKDFFNILRKVTLDDSATILNDLYESRSASPWGLIPTT